MDDATVEAIAALEDATQRACEAIYAQRQGYWPSEGERHRIAIALLAAALPDPRPTEAGAEKALSECDWTDGWQALRDLGCFRPEPAAQNDSSITYGAEPVPAAEPPTRKRHNGEVMVQNLSTDPGSHHYGRHWRIAECTPLACRPENTHGPGGDDPLAADGVMVVQSLGEPVPVPMVTVRREIKRRGGTPDLREVVTYDEMSVPADQIPEDWEPVDG